VVVARVSKAGRDPLLIARDSVKRLLDTQPWLYATIDQAHFPPRWATNTRLTVNDIVQERSGTVELEDLLRTGSRPDLRLNLKHGPLWCLDVVKTKSEEASLVLVIHHVLCDGLGARNMMGEILGEITGNASHNASSMKIPPALETSMDIRPSWAQFLRALYNNIVIPMLPEVLRPAPMIIWPNPVRPGHNPQLHMISLDAATLVNIKRRAQDHGVRTLHPVIYAAVVSSLQCLRSDAPDDGKVVGIDTPMSLRDPALGHPSIGGNYVANHKRLLHHNGPSTFWDTARDYAQEITNPSTRLRAIGEAGMLAYMPSSPPVSMSGAEEIKESGWERMFRKQLKSDRPYRTSIVLTNIGSLSLSDTQAETPPTTISQIEVAWAQTPSVIGAAICVNVSTTLN
jgi:NRPS condensation-like uncharacterized protein